MAFKALRIMWLCWLLGPVLVAGLLWTSTQSASASGGAWLYMGRALSLAVGSLSLTAEGAVARGSGISWSGTHHRWPVVTSKSRLAHPNQDLALVGATGVLVVLPTMVALHVVSGSRFEAFADYPSDAGLFAQVARSLEVCFSPVGGGAFTSANATGQLVKVLVAAMFVAYAVVLVGRIAGCSLSPTGGRRS